MSDTGPRELRPGLPECPDWLSEAAKEHWGAIAADVWRLGLLSDATMPLLAAYVTGHAQFIEVSETIRREGYSIKYPSGYQRPHPLNKVQLGLMRELMRLSDRLGLTPLARARIRARRAGL